MSDTIADWLKDHLTVLYQTSGDSTENISNKLSTIFENDAHIVYNHEQIDLSKFGEGLQASLAAVSRAEVEWKEIFSLPGGTGTNTQVRRPIYSVVVSLRISFRAALLLGISL